MSSQTRGRTFSSDQRVPFRWPTAWTDPALLRLLAESPINCLLLESLSGAKAIADAARAAGLTALEWGALGAAPLEDVKWDSPAPQIAITGLVWPRIKLSAGKAGNMAEAGPTAAPWIDSNTWVARLAAARAPGRPVWLGFGLAKDDPVPGESDYVIAIADSYASGARWMLTLDEGLCKGLPAGDAHAVSTWSSIVAAVAFFEKHRQWVGWERWGPIGILSSFAGNDEFMGEEILNLAGRRKLLYRVLYRSARARPKIEDLPAVLYLDSDPPSPELKAMLVAYARSGGLLIVPRALAAQFPGDKTVRCPVAGFEWRSFGGGAVIAATQDWDDPYFLAADVHSLVGVRNDPAILFNAGSLWEHYSLTPDGGGALLQLVGFTSRDNRSVSVAPARPWRSAAMYTISKSAAPVMLEPVQVEGRMEFHLPPFSYYTALEARW